MDGFTVVFWLCASTEARVNRQEFHDRMVSAVNEIADHLDVAAATDMVFEAAIMLARLEEAPPDEQVKVIAENRHHLHNIESVARQLRRARRESPNN